MVKAAGWYMTDNPNLEKLMNAHLASIALQLSTIKLEQSEGFAEIKKSMDRRDERTDRDLRDINTRVDRLETTLNRWGGAFAFAVLMMGLGMPIALWLLGFVTR